MYRHVATLWPAICLDTEEARREISVYLSIGVEPLWGSLNWLSKIPSVRYATLGFGIEPRWGSNRTLGDLLVRFQLVNHPQGPLLSPQKPSEAVNI